mmetsp:Transcript_8057/g.17403  ORF Transcript_8057/g.17403 Transcript_8057/m.17403 type:complete len:266 (-) Transcript_8057:175-972(-)
MNEGGSGNSLSSSAMSPAPPPNTFGGIDVPALLNVVLKRFGGETSDLMAVVDAAIKSASDRNNINPATRLGRKFTDCCFGHYGSSATIMLVNQTAAELRLVSKADVRKSAARPANLAVDSTYPSKIPPGGIGLFTSSNSNNSEFAGADGVVTYKIFVYDAQKEKEWVDSEQRIAFEWNTPEGFAGEKYQNTAHWPGRGKNKRDISETDTIYDNTQIVGLVDINDRIGTNPTYTVVFSQKEIKNTLTASGFCGSCVKNVDDQVLPR